MVASFQRADGLRIDPDPSSELGPGDPDFGADDPDAIVNGAAVVSSCTCCHTTKLPNKPFIVNQSNCLF